MPLQGLFTSKYGCYLSNCLPIVVVLVMAKSHGLTIPYDCMA